MLLLIDLIRCICPTNCRNDGILYFFHRIQSFTVFCALLCGLCFSRHQTYGEPSLIILSPLTPEIAALCRAVAWNNAGFVPAQALSSVASAVHIKSSSRTLRLCWLPFHEQLTGKAYTEQKSKQQTTNYRVFGFPPLLQAFVKTSSILLYKTIV